MELPLVVAVDDDETTLSVVKVTLEAGGFSVMVAENGRDALELIKAHTPKAVLLDIEMPGMNGNDVLKELKADDMVKDIPILMLTGKGTKEDISHSLSLGASDYIVKPFDHDSLVIRLIIRHLHGKHPLGR